MEAQQLRLLYKGLMGSAWQTLLVECGLQEDEAVQVRKKVQEAAAGFATELVDEYWKKKHTEKEQTDAQLMADTPVHLRMLVQRMTMEVLDSAKTATSRGQVGAMINKRSWKRRLEWAVKRTTGQVAKELRGLTRRKKQKRKARCRIADTAAAAGLKASTAHDGLGNQTQHNNATLLSHYLPSD